MVPVWTKYPRPWSVNISGDAILDANSQYILDIYDLCLTHEETAALAAFIVERVNAAEAAAAPVTKEPCPWP